MFGNKAAGGCWLASCPGAPWVEASGTRVGGWAGGGAGAAGCGAGAPARPGRGGGRGLRRAAHYDPAAAGPAGLLSAPPAAEWRTPRPTRCCAAPGPCEPMASAWKPGLAAARGACGLGSGRPLRPWAWEKGEF